MSEASNARANTFPCVCGARMRIIDSRPCVVSGERGMRRRRRCMSCGNRITTYEVEETRAFDVRALHVALRAIRGQLDILIGDVERQEKNDALR